MTIKHLCIMKEVSLTINDYSPADSESGVFGFVVFEVYYHEDSYGFFSTLEAAKKHIKNLRKHFDYRFSISQHIVSL